MRLPMLTELDTSRSMIDVFGGYNHNLRIGEGEFYDMKNLSSSHYPLLSPRGARGVYASPTNPQGLIAKDAVCYVDCITEDHLEGARLYINDKEVEGLTLSSKAADLPKQLVSMGAYIIILPDKKWYNTQPKEGEAAYGNIEATHTIQKDENAFISLCEKNGLGGYVGTGLDYSYAEPSNPSDGDLWLCKSGNDYTLKKYSETQKMWMDVATTYVMIQSTNIGKSFEVGDCVNISGLTVRKLGADAAHDDDFDLNCDHVIEAKSDNYIVFTGLVDGRLVSDSEVTVSRKMPNMDFVVESGNRLWGCRYGVAANGEVVNEIYASKLGDFKNWNVFAGVSTDSYAASVGTDGQFTGAITHLGYPVFFKENCIHKVYGNYPANYQIQTTACRGVQKGSHDSLAIVNETLFYKSPRSVCAYDGSLPTEVSSAFGEDQYYGAVAGAIGNKYYISMADGNEQYHLFAFDTAKGLWHKEDNTRATAFCSARGDLYYIDAADKKIKTVMGSYARENENSIEWMAETGIIGVDSPDNKYISKLNMRVSMAVGSKMRVCIQYDSVGDWEQLFSVSSTTIRSFTIPIRPKRCDHLRLRIEGQGDVKIFSITKTIEQGSDV